MRAAASGVEGSTSVNVTSVVSGGADDGLDLSCLHLGFASYGFFVDAGAAVGLLASLGHIAVLELGQHFFRKQLDRGT